MTSADIGAAAIEAVSTVPDHQPTICEWLPPVVTFLSSLKDRTGKKFWLTLALSLVIGLIETYQREVCA